MKLLSFSVPAIVLLSLASPLHKTVYPVNVPAVGPSISAPGISPAFNDKALAMYDQLKTEAHGLNHEAFAMAVKGYRELIKVGKVRNTKVLTIIDYTLSSLRRRLFVVDLQSGKVLYNTFVAHGMNSGKEYPRKFSNAPSSLESSLGFYVTMNEYEGKNSLTLRLKGVEKGINDNALSRGIVLHGAPYVSAGYGNAQGFMGRSQGCPAVPQKETAPIIKSIKNGSAVFVYYPSRQYLGKTRLL